MPSRRTRATQACWAAGRPCSRRRRDDAARPGADHLITDGPFAETKEQLGGYYLLDYADLDEGIASGEELPMGDGTSIEIRPVMDYEAAGSSEHTQHAGAEA